ncbi:hypothetical protein NX801_12375 [Streptomyces sp. LP05-1]|uniref:Uncharacterized protein n=1 Tax=Streptomyces pyxinae TaxID=2970734 RepID=A0ABT2CGA8_9ACTN|nr:hypothetical protein [Streptomyces sp. LP05-1]MCS0636443.1 hypothetical protein [Streptomyces sp. LP05-1]
MRIVVGLLIALFGAFLAVAGPAFSERVGSERGRTFHSSDKVAFRGLGAVMAVAGLLYTFGVSG